MGETIAIVKIRGTKGNQVVEALVDTGATFTKIPGDLVSSLGIEVQEEIEVELSDSSVRRRKLGYAYVELEGTERSVPVTLGVNGERPLIGYTTLEILGLKVNPLTCRLERARPIEY